MTRWAATFALAGALALVGLGGCSSDSDDDLVVFAAASLTDPMTELAELYEADHPTESVELRFAGSTRLAAQLAEGATASVFASADAHTMDAAVAEGSVGGEPLAFATNRIMVVTPIDNPANIAFITDLAVTVVDGTDASDATDADGVGSASDAIVAACAVEVPCGRATDDLLNRLGITVDFATREPNVRAVLTRVREGEVDAGFVYHSDATQLTTSQKAVLAPFQVADAKDAGRVTLLAATVSADDPAAQEFVEFLNTPASQEVLGRWGFLGVPAQ